MTLKYELDFRILNIYLHTKFELARLTLSAVTASQTDATEYITEYARVYSTYIIEPTGIHEFVKLSSCLINFMGILPHP